MNSRRKFLLQGSLATTALFVAKPFKSLAKFSSPFSFFGTSSIMLLHTHDLHSPMYASQHTGDMIANLKNSNNCILLDTGTNYSGNDQQQKEDNTIAQLMKTMGYDAALTGSPAFAGSLITDNQAGTSQTYKIVNKGAIRIGVIGAWVNRTTLHEPRNQVKAINEIATKLKQEHHCNLVICLSNFGYENKNAIDDISLATQSTNIDVIISSQPSGAAKQATSVLLNKNNEEVVINNAGDSNVIFGKIEIGFDGSGKKNRIRFDNVLMAPDKKHFSALSA